MKKRNHVNHLLSDKYDFLLKMYFAPMNTNRPNIIFQLWKLNPNCEMKFKIMRDIANESYEEEE